MKSLRNKIKAYMQGNGRKLLMSRNWTQRFVPEHIKEQIDWRLKIMDRQCIKDGVCKMCGCSTPGLQMANNMCDKPCYPPMMNKEDWEETKHTTVCSVIVHKRNKVWIYEK